MSQNTIDCPNLETHEPAEPAESAQMRFDLVVRARREILSGRYDDDVAVEQMLAGCMDSIVEDAREA